jgi:CheY-like chemotaxis protein
MARVLIVDDDDQVRRVFRKALEAGGYQVTEAPNGRIGARLYRESPSDLIIMDLIMPEQEGLETITALRRDFPDVKIIAISGGGRGTATDYLSVARKLGAMLSLEKPITPGGLLHEVDQLLGRQDR